MRDVEHMDRKSVLDKGLESINLISISIIKIKCV